MSEDVVLVVEDEADVREMIRSVVESALHVQTVSAENGLEALELVARNKPSLVLLDVMLPGIDGLEVARRLRAGSETRELPIIAVTAGASRQDALDAGCTEYLQKPFDIDQLLFKMQKHLAVHPAFA